jgi:hypothetical protein
MIAETKKMEIKGIEGEILFTLQRFPYGATAAQIEAIVTPQSIGAFRSALNALLHRNQIELDGKLYKLAGKDVENGL